MPSGAKTRPASAKSVYQLLPVIGPTGGVDLRSSPTQLAVDKARTLVNWSLTEPGALAVRPGYLAFSSVLGAGRIHGAARVYLNTSIPSANSTTFNVVGWSSGIYTVTDAGVWSAQQKSGFSTLNAWDFPSDRDLVAIFDGATTPWKSTNGSSWTRMGIASGSSATASTGTSGSVGNGDYELNYTYKDRDLAHESNGSSSPSTVTLTASTGSLKLIVPNSTDPQVDAIVVYARKVSAGETVRRKVSSGVQSAGVSSTFVITSTSWITNDEEPTDHDTPPVLSFGVVWKNRWWARSATVTNRIHFTQLFDPQSWPGLFYIDIPFSRGDYVQAICPLGDALFVFGTTKIFVITGLTSLDFEVRPAMASQDGALGFRAVTPLENGVVHAGGTGVYIFDGATDQLLSYELEPAWQDLIAHASASDLAQTAVVYHQLKKELRVGVARRYPSGARGEWILDLNRTRLGQQTAWTATDRDIAGYVLWDGPEGTASNRQRLFSWASSSAQLFEEATGTTANSSNLTAEYEGPGLTLGAFVARWPNLRIEYEPHGGACSMEPIIDGASQGTQAVGIGAGLSVYDTALYDIATYAGAGRRQAYLDLPLTAEGRTYVQKLTYAGQETFKWFSYHVGVTPESQSRSFSE